MRTFVYEINQPYNILKHYLYLGADVTSLSLPVKVYATKTKVQEIIFEQTASAGLSLSFYVFRSNLSVTILQNWTYWSVSINKHCSYPTKRYLFLQTHSIATDVIKVENYLFFFFFCLYNKAVWLKIKKYGVPVCIGTTLAVCNSSSDNIFERKKFLTRPIVLIVHK